MNVIKEYCTHKRLYILNSLPMAEKYIFLYIVKNKKQFHEIILYLSGIKGIENIGNTCYFNTAIQCLFSSELIFTIVQKGTEFEKNLYNTYIYKKSTEPLVKSIEIRDNMNYRQQSDIRVGYDSIIKYSPNIKKLIDIRVEQKTTCTSCNNIHDSKSYVYQAINIPFKDSLHDSLNGVVATIPIYCLKCKKEVPHIITNTYYDPYVLCLRYSVIPTKLPIEFQSENVIVKLNNQRYELTGIALQKAFDKTSGHYISYVKKQLSWIECNDARISLVNEWPKNGKLFRNEFAPILMIFRKIK